MSWKLLSKTGADRLRSRALALLTLTVGAAVSGALLLHGAGATAATPTTFGRVDPGSAWFAMSADYKRSSRFQLPERAAVTHLVAHVDGFGAGLGLQQQLRFAVYADNGGVPDTLLGQTQVGTVAAPYYAGKLPLNNWTYAVPFGSGDPKVILDVAKQLYRDVPALVAELERYNQKLDPDGD